MTRTGIALVLTVVVASLGSLPSSDTGDASPTVGAPWELNPTGDPSSATQQVSPDGVLECILGSTTHAPGSFPAGCLNLCQHVTNGWVVYYNYDIRKIPLPLGYAFALDIQALGQGHYHAYGLFEIRSSDGPPFAYKIIDGYSMWANNCSWEGLVPRIGGVAG